MKQSTKFIWRSLNLLLNLCLVFSLNGQTLATCDDLELSSGVFSPAWRAYYGKWTEYNNPCGINYTSFNSGFVGSRHGIRNVNAGMVNCYGNNLIPYVPPGFSHSIQLGNDQDGRQWERLETTIHVTNDNSLIEINLAVFFEDDGHSSCKQPRCWVKVFNENNQLIQCGDYQVIAAGNLPGWGNSFCPGFNDPIRFLPWTKMSIDLRQYLGQNITLQFQTMDCSESGHFGFALFAVKCLQSEITASAFCPGDNAITLTAPEGFASYLWNNGQTNRSITIQNPTPGTVYTVTLSPYSNLNGFCQVEMDYPIPPVAVLNVPNDTSFCQGMNLNLNATISGNPDGYTFFWNTGSSTSGINVTAPGNYSVTATNGICNLTGSVFVSENSLPVYQTILLNAPCNGSTGQAIITPDTPGALYAYSWSNGGTGSSQSLLAGAYTVTVTDMTTGCKNVTTLLVNQPDPLNLVTSPNIQKCPESSVILTAAGNFTNYEWSTGAAGSNLDVFQPGSYSVTATDAAGCTVTNTILVSDYPSPGNLIIGDSIICAGATATLTAPSGTGFTYAWFPGNADAQSIEVSPGTYSVTVTSMQGCTNVGTTAVSDVLPPVATVSSNLAILCHPDTAVLTAVSSHNPASFVWSNGQSGTSVPVNQGGTYQVTVTDSEGCTGTASVTLPAYDYAPPAISGDAGICPGQETTVLSAEHSNITTYAWAYQQQSTPDITISQAGTYSVTVTYDYGCTATNSFQVVEHELPQPVIQGPAMLCDSTSATFSLTSSFTAYTWSTGASTATIEAPAGTYSVTISDANGCTGIDSFSSAVIPLISVYLESPEYICKGQPAVINLKTQLPMANGTAWLSSDSGLSYEAPLVQGIATWTVYLPFTTTVYIDSITVPGYDCVFLDMPATITVEVDNMEAQIIPELFGNGYPLQCTEDANASALVSVQNGNAPYTYAWSIAGAETPLIHHLGPGTYTVTTTDARGCTVVSESTIVAPPPITIQVMARAPVCHGLNDGIIGFDVISSQGTVSVEMNGGDQTPIPADITGLPPGVYNIHLSDTYCFQDTTIVFPALPHYSASIGDSSEVLLELGDQYIPSATLNFIPQNIAWMPGNYLNDSTRIQPVITPYFNTEYVIRLTTQEGCIVWDTLSVKVENSTINYVPNVFNPGSRDNSTFFISSKNGAVDKLSIRIFDRWGNLIFKNIDFLPNDPAAGWDGTHRGKPLDPAVFVYYLTIEYKDGFQEDKKGDITLIR